MVYQKGHKHGQPPGGPSRNPEGGRAVQRKRAEKELFKAELLKQMEARDGKPLSEVVRALIAIASNKKAPASAVAAIREIADRMDGKAKQTLDLQGATLPTHEVIILDPMGRAPERGVGRKAATMGRTLESPDEPPTS